MIAIKKMPLPNHPPRNTSIPGVTFQNLRRPAPLPVLLPAFRPVLPPKKAAIENWTFVWRWTCQDPFVQPTKHTIVMDAVVPNIPLIRPITERIRAVTTLPVCFTMPRNS